MVSVAAVILAAGKASRFRAGSDLPTKLVARLEGMPLVAHVARAALASRARPVIVVTGHARAQVEAALEGLAVQFVHNPGFASGLSGSLAVGLAAVPGECAGALILLGDMPKVQAATCDALVAAFAAAPPATSALVPHWHGQTGNPLLLARGLFADVAGLAGDQGARKLLGADNPYVLAVEVEDPGVLADVDTPQALTDMQKTDKAENP